MFWVVLNLERARSFAMDKVEKLTLLVAWLGEPLCRPCFLVNLPPVFLGTGGRHARPTSLC